jgi:hypothetical protein
MCEMVAEAVDENTKAGRRRGIASSLNSGDRVLSSRMTSEAETRSSRWLPPPCPVPSLTRYSRRSAWHHHKKCMPRRGCQAANMMMPLPVENRAVPQSFCGF